MTFPPGPGGPGTALARLLSVPGAAYGSPSDQGNAAAWHLALEYASDAYMPVTEIDRGFVGSEIYLPSGLVLTGDLTVEGTVALPGGVTPGGAAAGDLGGDYPAPAVQHVSGVQPSGDVSGVTDTGVLQFLLNTAPPGGTVTLGPGVFWTNAPLVIPPWVTLEGTGVVVNNSALSDNCTTIKPAAGFSQGSAAEPAALLLLDQVTGGYSAISAGQVLRRINLDGSQAPSGTHGLASTGKVYGAVLRDCCVQSFPGTGLFGIFTSMTTGQADGWRLNGVIVARCGRNVDVNIADLVAIDVHAIGATTDHNFYIRQAVNSVFSACRSGNAAASNWVFAVNQSAANGWIDLIGCTSDTATGDGMVISYGAAGGPELHITGYSSTSDGLNGGAGGDGKAAVRITSAPQPVAFTGLNVVPGSVSPASGVVVGGAAEVTFSGGKIQAITTPMTDAGGNTRVRVSSDVVLANGAAGSAAFQVPVAAAGSAAGNSPPGPAMGTTAAWSRGTCTFGTGTSPSAGAQVAVTFATALPGIPVVALTPANPATGALGLAVTSVSEAGFTATSASAPSASQSATTYQFAWIAII